MSQSDLTDPIQRALTQARVKLYFSFAFFGQLAARLELVDATKWCKTAATDGKHFFYNREFIKSLDQAELLFLFAHEILHIIFEHFNRRAHRDKDLWNMATDYAINWILVDSKVGKMPANGLYDKRFTDEMTAEDIYEILKKNSVTIKMPLDEHLEVHTGEGDDDGEGADGQGSVNVTIVGQDGPPKITKDDVERIKRDLKADMIRAAQAAGIGNVPKGIQRLLDSLVQPTIDWRSALTAHLKTSKHDFTFRRLSRKTWGSGFILPGQDEDEKLKIAIGMDTSGSISEPMLRRFLSEIIGITDQFRHFELYVATWDTQVYNWQKFDNSNIGDLMTYDINGGGGTDPRAFLDYVFNEGIDDLDRVVMMTDGAIYDWGEEMFPTLWLISGDPQRRIKAPYGVTSYFDDEDDVRGMNWLQGGGYFCTPCDVASSEGK